MIARTDALQPHGYEEAISRLQAAYAAGADVAFFEGLVSKEQGKQIVRDLFPLPVRLNMVEAGATPSFSATEAKEAGFKIMIVPFVTIAPAYSAMKEELEFLKSTGSAKVSKKMRPKTLFRICGVNSSIAVDIKAGGQAFMNGID